MARPTQRPPNGVRRRAVAELLNAGASQAEAARTLGISPATVSYHARALGIPVRAECARRHDWEAIQAYHDAGNSVRKWLTQWRGRPLSMALHHVNGDGRDNRLGNLQLLCHSQTENFSGRWPKRVEAA